MEKPRPKSSAGSASARRQTSRTAARPASGAAKRTGSTARKRPSSAARTSTKRTGASNAGRSGAKRRGRGLDLRDVRLWLIVAAFVIAIALAVILALRMPVGRDEKEAVPASAPAQTEIAEPVESPEAEPSAEPADQDAEAAVPDEAEPDEAEAADVNLNPQAQELIAKYHVLDGIPQTEQPLGLPESARVDDSYFDDALFVGDSVTLALRQYVVNTRKTEEPNLLGEAKFLAAQSFGSRNALREVSENSIHPTINGVKMTLEEAIAQSGAKKLYIMLGMNDVGVSGWQKAVEYMLELLNRIEEKSPGIQIFVESATPRLKGTHPNTNGLFFYDIVLYDALQQRNDPNIHFVDVAYVMRDEKGKLFESYCSDPNSMALHFNNEGCRHWIDYLYTHALV